MPLSLDMFSTELLLKIFKYLEIIDLCRLKQTCKRFRNIIETWSNTLEIDLEPVLVTNQKNDEIRKRSLRILSAFEKVRISKNWILGRYLEKSLLNTNIRYLPWIQLEKDCIWISRGRDIKSYKRHDRGIYPNKVEYLVRGQSPDDVCHFVKKNNLLLGGQTNGTLFLWSLDNYKFYFDIQEYHGADIESVDFCDDIIVTGSKDNTVKLTTIENLCSDNSSHKIDLLDRVWSVAIAERNTSLIAIGTAGRACPLNIYDSNHDVIFAKLSPLTYRQDTGVFDVKWESPSVVWSAGFDTHVRKWDLRTGACVQAFPDPLNTTIYCFQYDNFYTLLTGTSAHGRVVLWDTRRPHYIQMYFMKSCRQGGRSSPIYSLSYDAQFLYAATDRYLNFMNFSRSDVTARDYSGLL